MEKLYRLKPEVLKYVNTECRSEGTLEYWKGTIYKECALEEVKQPLILSKQISIEIHPEEKEMTWDEAVAYCKSLGKGWRLPTIQELWHIYENENLRKEFNAAHYWSSSEVNANLAWYFYFLGVAYYGNKYYTNYVRAVRDIYE